MKTRQRLRTGIILAAFFIFPAIYYFFSPYLIVVSAAQGIINGSFAAFGLMFISSLFLGRAYCGWVCPAAGCQEAIIAARPKRVTRGNFIKWVIWIPWVAMIAVVAVRAGGYHKVDLLYKTSHGISISDLQSFITFMCVLLLIVLPAFAVGRRSFCHHLCWMAPFMVTGRKLRNLFAWPSLRLASDAGKCMKCHACTNNCPMSLPVEDMVSRGGMEHTECILCGTCVDGCGKSAISYTFSAGK